ncbi:MAG: RDD family protein [Desulfomonile tiedjei]|uniref:RDD family protein n=1 Tax=Desulfomonile tiedjei TaxID=2358 RepID=A0A9D6V647_9BACT|nr:RDD family protein [Desulfomonile tiedjei]
MKKNVKMVTIETPDHLELQFQLAGIGVRFIAFLIDKAIQIGTILGIVLFFSILLFFTGQMAQFVEFLAKAKKGVWQWLIAIGFLFYGIVMIGYFLLFEYFWSGSTPGKRYQEIRVIRKDARPISFFDSAVRNILRFVDILAEVYPLGLIVMFLDSQNRRLGDLAAGTIVISEREARSPAVLDVASAASSADPELQTAVAAMTAEDYRIVSKFLSRREELDTEHRLRLASEISKRILLRNGQEKIGADPEHFLEIMETLYRERTRIL